MQNNSPKGFVINLFAARARIYTRARIGIQHEVGMECYMYIVIQSACAQGVGNQYRAQITIQTKYCSTMYIYTRVE